MIPHLDILTFQETSLFIEQTFWAKYKYPRVSVITIKNKNTKGLQKRGRQQDGRSASYKFAHDPTCYRPQSPANPLSMLERLEYFDIQCFKMEVATGRVRGILFDFDNTLVPTVNGDLYAFHAVKNKLLEFFAVKDAENISSKFQTLVTKISPWPPESLKLGHHQWHINLREKVLACEAEVTCDSKKPSAAVMYELWRKARLEKIAITNEIASLILELSKVYKIAIVTNSASVIQREKLAACGAGKLFNTIVISGEEPHPKPHPSIFHTACSLIDVRPQSCVMIDDSLPDDIQGGKNAGLLALVWIKLEGNCLNEGDPEPDFVIDSVLSLPSV